MSAHALEVKQASVEEVPDFLFMSAHRCLRATGVFTQISTPAAGGEHSDSLFQHAVQDALNRARKAGLARPLIMGAIPFDVTQPSCLYVPHQYEFFARPRVALDSLQALAPLHVLTARSVPDEQGFKAAVRQAIANFRHSDIRKAVLSRVFELEAAQPVVVEQILARLQAQNPTAYHFRVPLGGGVELLGASPELLLRKVAGQIFSNPLAGSAKRQADAQVDQLVSQALLASSKDAYEHRLVIDDIRRVLAPHCAQLDVPEAPALLSTAAMWHLSTAIQGQLHDPQTSVLQLACQLHPTPAVCGFPTRLARKLIALVEPFERGLFSGMVGWCDAEGNGEWVVTIRCGTVQGRLIRLFAGAGIVEASCPDAEWAETEAKLGTMRNAFGLSQGGA